jgi:hypothetical protein
MGGPYKMCDQCDGPGTRCKRCPLEDGTDETTFQSPDVNACRYCASYCTETCWLHGVKVKGTILGRPCFRARATATDSANEADQ